MGTIRPFATNEWTTIVLAGGRSSRLGYDKVTAILDDHSLLDTVLVAIPADVPCIVVGPDPGPLPREAIVTIEDQPGAGPVAGIAAGLRSVETEFVAVVAVDMPFVGKLLAGLVAELAVSDLDGVVPVDETGRRQPLAAAYRTDSLRTALTGLGTPEGKAVHALIAGMHLAARPAPTLTLMDVDTADDLAAARRSVRSGERGGVMEDVTEDRTMDDWVAAVTSALGIEQMVDVDLILDVARDAAHGVARPAAPVTTFLLGCAVGSGMSAQDAAQRVTALAKEWPAAG